MDEVTGPVIAVGLVLFAVFIPAAFLGGISGPVLPPVRRDDRRLDGHLGLQFADAQPGAGRDPAAAARPPIATRSTWLLDMLLGWFFRLFNVAFGAGTALLRPRGGRACSA